MRKFTSMSALLAAGALLVAGSASAASMTTTFTVTATVLAACTLSAGSTLAFGNYTPGGGAVNATNTVIVACTNGTAYTVALNGGTTTGGTLAQRLMAQQPSGSGTLQYQLYTSSSDSSVWGDDTGSSVIQGGTGTGLGNPASYTVFGNLPDNATNRNAATASYQDTITVILTF